MKNSKGLLGLAAALVALGVLSFLLQPVLVPKPDAECVPAGEPSSGFVDDDDPDCNISIESWEEISDWESSPKVFRILGLVLVLAGIVVGVVALVRSRRQTGPPGPTGPPPVGGRSGGVPPTPG